MSPRDESFIRQKKTPSLWRGNMFLMIPWISHFFYKCNMTLLIEVYTIWTAFVYNITKFTCQIHIYFHYFALLVYSHCINNWSHYDIFIHGYNIFWSNSLPHYPLLNLLLPHPRWSSFLSHLFCHHGGWELETKNANCIKPIWSLSLKAGSHKGDA